MKIYFFGGSFDPPHRAHKMIYKYCINFCDKFIFIPSGQTPGKSLPLIANYDRIEMLKLLIDKKDSSKVLIDDFEIKSHNKPNYTINTILYLQKKFNNSTLNMVIGEDQYTNLMNWKNYKDIIDKVKITCFKRSGFHSSNFSNDFLVNFNHNISSSKIRENLINGNSVQLDKYLNKKIINYINKNKLYRN